MAIGPGVARARWQDAMFSVAIKGCGIIIWDGDGEWRTFAINRSVSRTLAARVEFALQSMPLAADDIEVRQALLSIPGAGFLSADCEHGPGECDGEANFS